jgi:kinesin family member C1
VLQPQFFAQSGITGLLDAAIDGYRVCTFAFGQTGAGKTYTVVGPDKTITFNNEAGLLGRSLEYIFGKLHRMQVIC